MGRRDKEAKRHKCNRITKLWFSTLLGNFYEVHDQFKFEFMVNINNDVTIHLFIVMYIQITLPLYL